MKRIPPLALIFVTVFIDLVGFGIIIPVLPHYVRRLGADAFELGLLSASYAVMQFLFAPVLGVWSDRIGRKPILAVSMLGTAVASTLMGLAELWGGLGLLFFARSLAGLTGGNIAAAQAYVADVTTPEKRAQGMGLIGMAFGLGFILGPTIGGVLGDAFGVAVPFYAVAGLALVNSVAMWIFLPEPERKGAQERSPDPRSRLQRMRDALTHRETAIPIFLFFLVTAAFANLEVTIALLAKDRFDFTPAQTGYLFAYIGVVVAIVQGGLLRALVPRFGESRLVVAGSLMVGLSMVAISGIHGLMLLLVALAFVAFGNGILNPSLSAMISRRVSPAAQGQVLGVTQSMSSLGRVVGPALGGYLYSHFGTGVPYTVGGTLMVAASGLALRHAMRSPQVPDSA